MVSTMTMSAAVLTFGTRHIVTPFLAAPAHVRVVAGLMVLASFVVSALLFLHLCSAPSRTETESHCTRRASQLQLIFDIEAVALVRNIRAYLAAIGNTTIPAFVSYVQTLQPDPETVDAVTLYQRVKHTHRAQWLRDFDGELAAGKYSDIWSLPAVTKRPVNAAEMWPCIAQVAVSDSAKQLEKSFSYIGFDPLGESTRAAPLLRALADAKFQPKMSDLILFPDINLLGFNVYARSFRPVATKSGVSAEVAVGVHFVINQLFDGAWTSSPTFDYIITYDNTQVLRTGNPTTSLLPELATIQHVDVLDRQFHLTCYAQPRYGVFWFRHGSYLAATICLVASLLLVSVGMRVHDRLARALKSKGDLDIVRSLLKSLQGRAQAILHAIDVPVALMDVFGRMIPLNEPAREWMGDGRSGGGAGVFVTDVVVDWPPKISKDAAVRPSESRRVKESLPAEFSDERINSLPPHHSRVPHHCGHDPAHDPGPGSVVFKRHVSLLDRSRPPPTNDTLYTSPDTVHDDRPTLHQALRPGHVQVTVRRPADGATYPGELSTSRPFTVPEPDDEPLRVYIFGIRSRVKFMIRRISSWLSRAHRQVSTDSRTRLAQENVELTSVAVSNCVPTDSIDHLSSRAPQTSSLHRRRQPQPMPHAAHTSSSSAAQQQVVLITDRSDAANRAHALERAQADLAAAHQACTSMLLFLCHELRNPAHVVCGLLADVADDDDDNASAHDMSQTLARYLDQGALLLGQEPDSHVPGLPARDWSLVELVRTVCRHKCPVGIGERAVQVCADAHVLRMAPEGGAEHWQRMVRIMLALAVDLGGGGGDHRELGGAVKFVLSPGWPVQQSARSSSIVVPREWRIRLAIRIPVASNDGVEHEFVEDMQQVVNWTMQVATHRKAGQLQQLVDSEVPRAPPPPDPRSWAGLHMLVLWRQLSLVAGRDPRILVSVEQEQVMRVRVLVVALDVECHLVY